MTQTKYDFLTPEERLAVLTPRIQGLESQHYAMSLDAELGGGDPTRFEQVTKSLETLRKQHKELEAEIKAKGAKG